MINIEEPLLRDVGVNLCGRQIAMTEQFLHAAEIGTPVQQVGGEAVPQRVRAGRIDQARAEQMRFQQPTDTSSGQAAAALVQEERFLGGVLGLPQWNPTIEPAHGHRTNRTEPLAPSLASNSNQVLVKIEVEQVQPHQLADP